MTHGKKPASKTRVVLDESLNSAKDHSTHDASLSKAEQIRAAIHLAEGKVDCYAKVDRGECDQAHGS
jgi:hypothetical protein